MPLTPKELAEARARLAERLVWTNKNQLRVTKEGTGAPGDLAEDLPDPEVIRGLGLTIHPKHQALLEVEEAESKKREGREG